MGVFDKVNDGLTGKTTPADPGTLNKKGYDARPVPVPPSVAAARQKMLGGIQGVMGAHADAVHPVKNGGAS